ncbi:hypothetical protein PLANPX_1790 [Lacipirellula parvula]|uniref:Uncharacterized protein n=1 Tax=Lacipirellula parvula TaxID=2650471 RepID=A0A5K7X6L3_9BACT|nr:hypothetical protein PLANPX_1790 [Lacipirellula parvula]
MRRWRHGKTLNARGESSAAAAERWQLQNGFLDKMGGV